MTELMTIDIPHTEYHSFKKKKAVSKADIKEWEESMSAIADAKPEKINLNNFIIDGTPRNT